jgi:hypothetical protein
VAAKQLGEIPTAALLGDGDPAERPHGLGPQPPGEGRERPAGWQTHLEIGADACHLGPARSLQRQRGVLERDPERRPGRQGVGERGRDRRDVLLDRGAVASAPPPEQPARETGARSRGEGEGSRAAEDDRERAERRPREETQAPALLVAGQAALAADA